MRAQRTAPPSYSATMPISYIREWDIIKPETNANNITPESPLKQARMTTQYVDGLGRPVQSVIKQGSMVTGSYPVDWVSPIVYDSFGRQQFKYSLFAANNAGNNGHVGDGLFKLNPFQEDSLFCKNQFAGENWFYSQTNLETSPLNRVFEIFGPGNSWIGTSLQSLEANRHSIKTKYWNNTLADSVRIWNVISATNALASYTTTGIYPIGTLFKMVTADENNNQVVEFTDKNGKTILKKVQLTAAPDIGQGKGHSGWLCTYYIYDDLNNLRCVIQPRGIELMLINGWVLSPSLLAEQCFRYEYDSRLRMTMKKVPGGGLLYMVYDGRDRLIMTQDSLMRAAHKWLYSTYDLLNRQASTGIITDNTNYNNAPWHWTHADTSGNWPVLTNYVYEELSKTFYDDYNWRGGEGNPLKNTRSTTYDSYLLAPSNTIWPYPQRVSQMNLIKGMVTGTKMKILGTGSSYLYTVNFYDDNSRVAQVQSTNISGDSTIVTMQYSFAGQTLFSVTKEGKAGTNPQVSVALTQITYDSLGRVLKTENKISNTKVNSGVVPAAWKVIGQNEYDAMGQLKKKKLGSPPLDSLVYEYNIRGWLLGANRNYVKDSTSTSNWFGFDLAYDNPVLTINGAIKNYSAPQYNGNSAGMLWKSTGDDELRRYDFKYDVINRLGAADFNQFTGGNFSKSALVDFSVSGLNYDANGNILFMVQKGWKPGGSATIDSLAYNYVSNSNRLLNVVDRKNDTATTLGDFRSSKLYMTSIGNTKTNSATDYVYDGNGNMTVDKNKDIGYVHYNHLNLPDSVVVSGRGNIKFVYDAGGNKLKKVTTDGTRTVTTLYLYGVYLNDTLQYLPHEEGRVRYNLLNSSLQYDYMLKDHLGNVRMVLTEQKDTSFYPAASLETTTAPSERIYYSKVDSARVNKNFITGYPADPFTSPNDFIQKLNGNGVKVGTAILVKVMAGDRFNLRVSSWWNSGLLPGAPANPLDDLIAALAGGVNKLSQSAHPTGTELINSGALSPNLTAFLNNKTVIANRPKAYVNWILFDERFNYVAKNSGFEQVGNGNVFMVHAKTGLPISKNGYLYVYVGNETPNIDVFFDNLQLTHIRGPLIEETHYYPFGLTMNGISSKAYNFGNPQSRKKYNGKEEQRNEFSDGSGLEWLDYGARMYDDQIGRWQAIDSKAEIYYGLTPYNYAGNNPINAFDVDGRLFVFCNGFMLGQWEAGRNRVVYSPLSNAAMPNPNYKPYIPDRGFYYSGPKNNGETFSYWDGVDTKYKEAYKDEKAIYTNGSFTPHSTANARFIEGEKAGADLIDRLNNGQIKLETGETIKIVGHSHGAAYAAGIATALANSKYGGLIEFVDYISPHQPTNFTHPSNVRGRQFSTESDRVSSQGGFLGWLMNVLNLNGGSELGQIPGTSDMYTRKSYSGGEGGHYVDTWLNDLIKYWADLGITVKVVK